jgi:transposase
VARELGVHPEALRNWIRQDEADQGQRSDRLTSQQLEELQRLRRRVVELERANEILRAASAFFGFFRLNARVRCGSGGVRSFFRCPSMLVACPDVRPCRTRCQPGGGVA